MDEVDENDLDYKYTQCLMSCCPCLKPPPDKEQEDDAKRPVTALKIKEHNTQTLAVA